MTDVPDRRVVRTREALQSAFTRLFFSVGYDAVTIGDIAQEANAGRSTFYEHFDGNEDILWACMAPFFSVFAEAVVSAAPPESLPRVLEHLWQNRRHADAVFTGAPRTIISQTLARLIEARLAETSRPRRTLIPLRLAAAQLTEAQLTLVYAWLKGTAPARIEAVCEALHASSRASATALLRGSGG